MITQLFFVIQLSVKQILFRQRIVASDKLNLEITEVFLKHVVKAHKALSTYYSRTL